MSERAISALSLSVNYGGSGIEPTLGRELTESEAMQLLFGRSEGVQLKSDAATRYQSGNYESFDVGLWTGELHRLRGADTIETFQDDEGNRRMRVKGFEGSISDGGTCFVYDENLHLFAFWERADFPYTRIVSYLRRVQDQRPDIQLTLEPILEEEDIWVVLRQFDRVRRISYWVRHSQSPGALEIDQMIELLEASRVRESVSAPKGGSLDVDELAKNNELPQHQALKHISLNPDNGDITIDGEIQEERIVHRHSDPIRRRRVECEDDRYAIARALAAAARIPHER